MEFVLVILRFTEFWILPLKETIFKNKNKTVLSEEEKRYASDRKDTEGEG